MDHIRVAQGGSLSMLHWRGKYWDNYFDLNETLAEMTQCLMEEDGQLPRVMPDASAWKKDDVKIVALPPNDDTILMSASEFPSAQESSTSENPVNLSDALTKASNTGARPQGTVPDDESKILCHFSDTLGKMAQSIMDLEDGYFKALYEVIIETEKALRDISQIDSHYISRIVTVMASWQEAVQAASSHMENADLTIYLACCEYVWRATKEYVKEVIKAHEEWDAAHAQEVEVRKQAMKADDHEDPVIHLLDVMHKAVHAQAKKAVDAFLNKIQETLWRHVPVSAQGPLIANALSTAFQFQMSVWWMIGDECVHPLQTKHSDWCGLAGVIKAIVETFPNNCAIMFLPALAPVVLFSGTFKPASSEDDDDNDSFGQDPGLCRFVSDPPVPSGSGHSSFGCSPLFSSTPLLHGGCFILASEWKKVPSSSLGAPPADGEEAGSQPLDEDFDFAADDEGDSEENQPGGDDSVIDPRELEILQGIIKPPPSDQPLTMPKSGDKQGSGHLDGFGFSNSSGEDMDAKGIRSKKKGVTPIKMVSNPNQWAEEDIDIVCQIRYKTDLDRFQMYRWNKVDPADLCTINTEDSAYIKVARADPSTIIKKSVFSVVAYREVLWIKGGDTSKFNKEVGAKFKKSAKGSWALDAEKVAINWVMLVCQHENGVDVAYSDSDGFRCPGTMGLWDLHLRDALSRAKLQLPSGWVDANFSPLCTFWSTNNETLNNHVCKHYKMGLTCRADGFTMASEGKRASQAKKSKGKN